MKVEQKSEKAFVPVTITLETEEEVKKMINSLCVLDNETLSDRADEDGFDGDIVDRFEVVLGDELDKLIN